MLRRKELFPNVVEINHQAGQILGCNVYLVFAKDAWILIDIGYEDTVQEIVEMIRELDFPLSHCQTLVATHADVDHVQGLSKAKRLLRSTITAHPLAAKPLELGDRLVTFAEIQAQGIDMAMPPVKVLCSEMRIVERRFLKAHVTHLPERKVERRCIAKFMPVFELPD